MSTATNWSKQLEMFIKCNGDILLNRAKVMQENYLTHYTREQILRFLIVNEQCKIMSADKLLEELEFAFTKYEKTIKEKIEKGLKYSIYINECVSLECRDLENAIECQKIIISDAKRNFDLLKYIETHFHEYNGLITLLHKEV